MHYNVGEKVFIECYHDDDKLISGNITEITTIRGKLFYKIDEKGDELFGEDSLARTYEEARHILISKTKNRLEDLIAEVDTTHLEIYSILKSLLEESRV